MPADEYASTVRGGLKLKGGAPAGIKKKKKKSKPSSTTSDASTANPKAAAALQAALEDEDADAGALIKSGKSKGKEKGGVAEASQAADVVGEMLEAEEDEDGGGDLKTASERAHEEMRRKRLHDRLEKEGVKSHKQRVEELNKYLSKLSEHHDMPRIGPG